MPDSNHSNSSVHIADIYRLSLSLHPWRDGLNKVSLASGRRYRATFAKGRNILFLNSPLTDRIHLQGKREASALDGGTSLQRHKICVMSSLLHRKSCQQVHSTLSPQRHPQQRDREVLLGSRCLSMSYPVPLRRRPQQKHSRQHRLSMNRYRYTHRLRTAAVGGSTKPREALPNQNTEKEPKRLPSTPCSPFP